MAEDSPVSCLHDIIGAIEHIQNTLNKTTLKSFDGDLDRRRIVERNIEIISEASRRIPESIKDRHPEIPWRKVAGIGNSLRHDYERVIPDAVWKLSRDDLPVLLSACRQEMSRLE